MRTFLALTIPMVASLAVLACDRTQVNDPAPVAVPSAASQQPESRQAAPKPPPADPDSGDVGRAPDAGGDAGSAFNPCEHEPTGHLEKCRRYGHCTRTDEFTCIAGSDADCEQAEVCLGQGQCTAQGGTCVTSCHDLGDIERYFAQAGGTWNPECTLRDEDESCQETVACKERGFCRKNGANCSLSSEGCAAAPACKAEGLCQRSRKASGHCGAETDAQCEASVACGEEGRCRALEGKCVTAEQAAQWREETCGPEANWRLIDGDCEEHPPCDEECQLQRCRESDDCKVNGACGVEKVWEAFGGCPYDETEMCRERVYDCVVTAEGCAQTESCQKYGYCKVVREDGDTVCGK